MCCFWNRHRFLDLSYNMSWPVLYNAIQWIFNHHCKLLYLIYHHLIKKLKFISLAVKTIKRNNIFLICLHFLFTLYHRDIFYWYFQFAFKIIRGAYNNIRFYFFLLKLMPHGKNHVGVSGCSPSCARVKIIAPVSRVSSRLLSLEYRRVVYDRQILVHNKDDKIKIYRRFLPKVWGCLPLQTWLHFSGVRGTLVGGNEHRIISFHFDGGLVHVECVG